jgi:hypothetical protein
MNKKNSKLNNKKSSKLNNKSSKLNNKKSSKIRSIEDYECIGPCYPPNTFYYNPSNLGLIINPYPSCPIKQHSVLDINGITHQKISDKCFDEDINKGYLYFDIFSDSVQISTSSDNFLSEIYNLNNISEIVHFLSNSIDTIPIYSQKRILKAIYEVYYKFIEFPKLLFSKKILNILENIYKINNLDNNKIIKKLNNLKDNNLKDNFSNNFYSLFINE